MPLPEPDAALVELFRRCYGVILFGTLLRLVLQQRRFFRCERDGGYGDDDGLSGVLNHRLLAPPLLALWLVTALAFALLPAHAPWSGVIVAAALFNLFMARSHFIAMRWKGIHRGFGAPGFISYWCGAALLLLEASRVFAPSAGGMVLLLLQTDFGAIILVAGLYKWASGYRRNVGMDVGMANPQWGHWWRLARRIPPHSPFAVVNNQLAWSVEILAGALMIIPGTRPIGGVLLAAMFLYIPLSIRLNMLCLMVTSIALLMCAGDPWASEPIRAWLDVPSMAWPRHDGAPWLAALLSIGAGLSLALMPIAYVGMWINLQVGRRLPRWWQWLHDRWINTFGMILWRVFTAEVVRFFIEIDAVDRGAAATLTSAANPSDSASTAIGARPSASGVRRISHWGAWRSLRFSDVCEAITVTCIFTTLIYHPQNEVLFRRRLMRHARTIFCRDDEVLLYTYHLMEAHATGHGSRPVCAFVIEPRSGEIVEHALDPSFSPRRPSGYSRVNPSAGPGTYAPPPASGVRGDHTVGGAR